MNIEINTLAFKVSGYPSQTSPGVISGITYTFFLKRHKYNISLENKRFFFKSEILIQSFKIRIELRMNYLLLLRRSSCVTSSCFLFSNDLRSNIRLRRLVISSLISLKKIKGSLSLASFLVVCLI